LDSLLEDLMDLARLQAGQEHREVKSFDAAIVLRELCERMQPVAEDRSLFLKTDGPDTLPVEGDAVKTQRIAQNLLLNALKYTVQGGVTVSWGDSRQNDAHRWMLCVEDTGPGFHGGPGAPMANALEEATQEARQVDAMARTGSKLHDPADDQPADPRPVNQESGEGIGYPSSSACANCSTRAWKWTPTAGAGTSVRVVFPRRYDPGGHS
jgi:hypothetical protein